jgi:4-oxalocrotonate tautomerase
MPEVVIYLAEGREPEKKRALMKDISDAVVKNFGVSEESVIVQIVESKKADKMKGGLLFSERTQSKPAKA